MTDRCEDTSMSFRDGRHWNWSSAWLVTFASNLVVPVLFGCMLTKLSGCCGMALATSLAWWTGHRLFKKTEEAAKCLVIGGIVVAVTQVCPFLHIYAGSAAVNVWAHVGGPSASGKTGIPLSAIGAFLVTVMTATQLMVAAAMIGYVLRKAMQRANCD